MDMMAGAHAAILACGIYHTQLHTSQDLFKQVFSGHGTNNPLRGPPNTNHILVSQQRVWIF